MIELGTRSLAAISLGALAVVVSNDRAGAYTTCSPGGSAGRETCGPGVINEGVGYTPSGDLIVVVEPGTTINARPGESILRAPESGILIPASGPAGYVTPENVTVIVNPGATINSTGAGVAVSTGGFSLNSVMNGGTINASVSPTSALSQGIGINVRDFSTSPSGGDVGTAPTFVTNTARGVINARTGITAVAVGPITVTNAGVISAAQGIAASSLNGPTLISNSGTIIQTLPNAFAYAVQTGAATFTVAGVGSAGPRSPAIINNSGTLIGNIDAFRGATINNTGLITDGNLRAALGPMVLNNAGSFRGGTAMFEGGTRFGEVTVNNAGLFVPTGSIDFGGGTFTNSGALRLLDGPGPRTVGLFGLGYFANAGTIDLVNGRAGDQLRLNTNYAGLPGATLRVDVAGGPLPVADRLVIDGSAVGVTDIVVAGAPTPTSPFVNPLGTPVTVASIGGSVAPGAFRLAGSGNAGFYSYEVVERGSSILLRGAPNATAAAVGQVSSAATTLGFISSRAVLDHVQGIRDWLERSDVSTPSLAWASRASAPTSATREFAGLAAWAQPFADFERRDVSVGRVGTAQSFDVGYRQSTGGVLAGLDAIVGDPGTVPGTLAFGGFVGSLGSAVRLNATAGSIQFSGGSVGGYATYVFGGFFADVSARADLLSTSFEAPFVVQSVAARNMVLAATAGAKARLADGVYVAPLVGIEHIQTTYDRDAWAKLGISNAGLARARGGARAGTQFDFGRYALDASITALAYADLQTRQGTFFTKAGLLESSERNTRGELQAALDWAEAGTGLTGFVRTGLRVGDRIVGADAKLGIRYQW